MSPTLSNGSGSTCLRCWNWPRPHTFAPARSADAVALLDEALSLTDRDRDSRRAAQLLTQRGRAKRTGLDGDAFNDLSEAVRLLPADAPERAGVLSSLAASALVMSTDYARAQTVAADAVQAAHAAGDVHHLADTLTTMGSALFYGGDRAARRRRPGRGAGSCGRDRGRRGRTTGPHQPDRCVERHGSVAGRGRRVPPGCHSRGSSRPVEGRGNLCHRQPGRGAAPLGRLGRGRSGAGRGSGHRSGRSSSGVAGVGNRRACHRPWGLGAGETAGRSRIRRRGHADDRHPGNGAGPAGARRRPADGRTGHHPRVTRQASRGKPLRVAAAVAGDADRGRHRRAGSQPPG